MLGHTKRTHCFHWVHNQKITAIYGFQQHTFSMHTYRIFTNPWEIIIEITKTPLWRHTSWFHLYCLTLTLDRQWAATICVTVGLAGGEVFACGVEVCQGVCQGVAGLCVPPEGLKGSLWDLQPVTMMFMFAWPRPPPLTSDKTHADKHTQAQLPGHSLLFSPQLCVFLHQNAVLVQGKMRKVVQGKGTDLRPFN